MFSQPKVVSTKFHPGHMTLVEFSHEQPFNDDYIMVFLGGPGLHPESLTIHRPIGVTRLDTSEWVCTRTTDVHYLLAGQEDPDQAKFNKAKDKALLDFFFHEGLLIQKENKIYYPEDKVSGVTDRDIRLAECNRLMNEDSTRAQQEHKKNQEGKPKPAKFKYSKTKYDFMAEDMKLYEKSLKEKSSKDLDLKERIKQLSSGYETKGGPGRNEPQVSISSFKGKRKDIVLIELLNKIKKGVNTPEPTPGSTPGMGLISDTSEKKIQELEEANKRFEERCQAYEESTKVMADILTKVQNFGKTQNPGHSVSWKIIQESLRSILNGDT